MFADINIVESGGEYFRHTDHPLFSGGRKRLQVTEGVNAVRLLSLFGQAKAGTNLIARMDSWRADIAARR